MERITKPDGKYTSPANIKLKAYEDTGLDPKDILNARDLVKIACALRELNQYKELGDLDRLKELVEADKAGRCIKTKGFENRGDIVTGRIVYYADEETMEVQKGQITSVKTRNGNAETFLVNFPNFACSEEFHVSEWNDCVFRDYAEAEAAMEKMKEAPHD